MSEVPALTAEFEKTSGRARLLLSGGGTLVRMTRVREDIRVAMPNTRNVSERWSPSDHPAISSPQMGDCHLTGVLALVSDKLYLLQENKRCIEMQFDLQHLWLVSMNKNSLEWNFMTPTHSVFIVFKTLGDVEIIFKIAEATQELLGSSGHVDNLKILISKSTRSVLESDSIMCPAPALQSRQAAPVKGAAALGVKACSATMRFMEKDPTVQLSKKWWEALFAPTRYVAFLYVTGDVYIGNMTCGVRSGWGVYICQQLQRVYSCFWRHDRPYGFGRVKEISGSGSGVSFCGFFDGGQFGPSQQPPTLGHLVKKVGV